MVQVEIKACVIHLLAGNDNDTCSSDEEYVTNDENDIYTSNEEQVYTCRLNLIIILAG